MSRPLNEKITARVVEAYQRIGTIGGTARDTKVDRATVRSHLKKAGLYDDRPLFAGRVSSLTPAKRALPPRGRVKRYMLTSAQNNTLVASKIWDNFTALADEYDAEVLVGSFTYNKSSYGPKSTKRGKGPTASDQEDLWYDPEIEPYLCDEPVELAPGLVWCGEMNILPTASRPLSDLEVYTGRKSGIFPHVKVAMTSVASGKHETTKFNYTTGTVTKRNYIQKKAGLKAEFHHVYGGLIVEVDSEGRWFVRQLNADSKGTICDVNLRVEDGVVTGGHRVKTISWGDIHDAESDAEVMRLAFEYEDSMLNVLEPEEQFMHDVLDFRSRNPHTFKKGLIHDRFQAYILGHDDVAEEVHSVADFLASTRRPWCKTYVVDSNHDNFMMEWLRIGDYRDDPVNAVYFLELQLHVYKSIAERPREKVNLLRHAVENYKGPIDNVYFLGEDASHIVLGVEHAWHGDRGPNGARGTPANIARMGRKVTRGHEHSAGIHDGVFTSGLSGRQEQGYNKGPSSWSPSHTVQYQTGKRAIYTMFDGKWRA